MAKFAIETCSHTSVDELCKYIDSDWVKNHIFVKSRLLLDWQHLNSAGNYNFIIARDIVTGEVCGVLGFIFTSHFSIELKSERDVWLAIWKVKEGTRYSGLGLKLLAYLKREYKVKTICSIGLSKTVIPMYEFLNFEVGQLKQFVFINDALSNYNILEIGSYKKLIVNTEIQYSLDKVDEMELMGISKSDNERIFNCLPKKNTEYIINRYIKHPMYSYQVYSIKHCGEIKGLIIMRMIEKNDSKVMRIIDFQGENDCFLYLNIRFKELLAENQCEYIDFVQKGIQDEFLIKGGFVVVDDIEGLIVPEYFEPLVKKNLVLDYARLGQEPDFFLCKGDSDQDRPSQVKAN